MTDSSLWRFSHHAMGSEFTIAIPGVSRSEAHDAARAAFRLLSEIESALSRFRIDSDIGRFNAVASPSLDIHLSIYTAECLAIARRVWEASLGAFDPAIGALLEWRRSADAAADAPAGVLARSGMHLLGSNTAHTVVRPLVEGLQLDLGGVGKGYAVDRAAQLLREDWDIPNGLVQGGESSLLAWGDFPGAIGWPAALRSPADQSTVLAQLQLRCIALSGSGQALHGAHTVDPRTGIAVPTGHAVWTCSPSAAEADALSTALMILNEADAAALFASLPGRGGLLRTSGGKLQPVGDWLALTHHQPPQSEFLQ